MAELNCLTISKGFPILFAGYLSKARIKQFQSVSVQEFLKKIIYKPFHTCNNDYKKKSYIMNIITHFI